MYAVRCCLSQQKTQAFLFPLCHRVDKVPLQLLTINVFFNLCSLCTRHRTGFHELRCNILGVWFWLSHLLSVLTSGFVTSLYLVIMSSILVLIEVLHSGPVFILLIAFQSKFSNSNHSLPNTGGLPSASTTNASMSRLYRIVSLAITSLQQISVHLNTIWAVFLMVCMVCDCMF